MSEEAQKLVTLLIAVSGLLLGLFNTWRLWDRDRVKLRLKSTQETWGAALGNPSAVFSIRVENSSTFPITIEEAGVVFEKAYAPCISFSQTLEKDGDTWTNELPLRIEPRNSITLTGSVEESEVQKFEVKYLFVKTACGVTKKVDSAINSQSADST